MEKQLDWKIFRGVIFYFIFYLCLGSSEHKLYLGCFNQNGLRERLGNVYITAVFQRRYLFD